VPTVVHGVNRAAGRASIISCASCTTNCITPVIEILGRGLGVLKATMTTIPTSADEVNRILREEARSDPRGESRRPDGPIVDLDAFIHSPGCPLAPLMGCS
jgi:glyceraldehyde-3-phosphate dehydrogenase/erythrose-4-phosphate dehydrogenase